jgi:hypothetical protein
MVWQGMARHGKAWQGMAWQGMVRHGKVWQGMARHGNSLDQSSFHCLNMSLRTQVCEHAFRFGHRIPATSFKRAAKFAKSKVSSTGDLCSNCKQPNAQDKMPIL